MDLRKAIQVSSYDDSARLHGLYTSLEKHEGWRDLMARVQRMRSDITSELLCGSVDKFGKVRDAEKRAVLITLDRLLAIVPTAKAQYDLLRSKKMEQEQKFAQKDGIHGMDAVSSTYGRGNTPF